MLAFTTRCLAYLLAIAFTVHNVAVVVVESITIKLLNTKSFGVRYSVSLQCLENKKLLKNDQGKTSCSQNGGDAECRFNLMANDGIGHQCPKQEYIVTVSKKIGGAIPLKQRMYRRIADGEHVEVKYRGRGLQYDKTTAITIHPRNKEWDNEMFVDLYTHYRVYLTCVATGEKLQGRDGKPAVFCGRASGCVFPLVRKNGNSLVYTKCPDQKYRIVAAMPLCRSHFDDDFFYNKSIHEAIDDGQQLITKTIDDITIPEGEGDVEVVLKCSDYVPKPKPAKNKNTDSDDYDELDYGVALV